MQACKVIGLQYNKDDEETFERYQLLSKEVQYVSKYIPNWEVFDFDNLQKVLDEMKELQQKLKK